MRRLPRGRELPLCPKCGAVPRTAYEIVEKVYDYRDGKWKYIGLDRPEEKATLICSECGNEWQDYLR